MSCTTCLKSKPIVSCTMSIKAGKINDANKTVSVKLENMATGRINWTYGQSDGSGNLSIDVSDIGLQEHVHELSVYEVDDLSNKLDLTFGGEVTDCVEVKVVRGELQEQILSLA